MRGRPAHKTYLLARQPDLFPDLDHQAQLEKKFPYLQAMRLTVDLSISSRISSQGATSADRAGAARSADRARSAGLPPCTNRGGKSPERSDTQHEDFA